MVEFANGFISKHFLRSVWARDYEAFKGSPEEQALTQRLKRWAALFDPDSEVRYHQTRHHSNF
ncbi:MULTISPECIES: hypothetical protein [Acidiphilium]|uniref:Uncharacterized protein n=1 Tax=Acidiphilium iwatense TaxID=768198 RepID=A0ABS9DTW5_9PROT|nr:MULTISPECIES: hypothetical protein [Acidiphilium]MCF3946171.1 hypothetical protein [Acidiphilium iwatense]